MFYIPCRYKKYIRIVVRKRYSNNLIKVEIFCSLELRTLDIDIEYKASKFCFIYFTF